MKGLNWIIVVVGVLAFIAPFVFGFTGLTGPFISNLVVGILLVLLGLGAALYANIRADQTFDWINAVLGLWLLISPFVLGFTAVTSGEWTDVVLGIIALVVGVWAAMSERRVTA